MPRRALALIALALLTLQACAPRQASTSAPAPATAAPAPWYEPEIQAFEAADRASPPRPGQVLFVGSSSIRLWSTLAQDMAPAPVLNRGFGGSQTPDVLAVFDRIVKLYNPSVIVYYCGDNDLGTTNTNAASAANGFIAFDQRARALWPNIRTLYIPIKPSLQRWNNWPAMQRANALVRDYCEATPNATYLDTVSSALTPDGTPDPATFMEDGLHLNAEGYRRWNAVVRPAVLIAWTRANAQAR